MKMHVSPYWVVDDKYYSQHFYAGSERILSEIGCGGLQRLEEPIEFQTEMKEPEIEEPEPEYVFTPIDEKQGPQYVELERTLPCLEKDPEIIYV